MSFSCAFLYLSFMMYVLKAGLRNYIHILIDITEKQSFFLTFTVNCKRIPFYLKNLLIVHIT